MSFDLGAMLKDVSDLDTTREQIEYIRLDQIDSDPNNFYQIGGIDALADNIATCGLQQPIRVRKKPDGRYITVSGHRRRAAMELLAKDEPERWEEIPCIVEQDAVSPALQQLRLIYANANTRTMTSAELGEQAAQVEKLLYQLKEEGYEFPGRMRDHVAEAVNASKTKLARLKVIRNNLIPQFRQMWEANKLRESVAYVLAGQTPVRQQYMFSGVVSNGELCASAETLTFRFRRMDEMQEKCDTLSCKFNVKCDHDCIRLQKIVASGYVSCTGCCLSCSYLASCQYSCARADAKKKKLYEKAKSEKKKEAEQKREKEQPEKDLLATSYSRVSRLRKERNVTAEDFVKVSLGFAYDRNVKRLNEIEGGKALSLQDRMPGGIWANEAMHLIAVADLLGCSIDYLLGREVSNSDTAPVIETAPELEAWRTGEPPEPGDYVVYASCCGILYADCFHWDGNAWCCGDDPDTDEVLAWTYPPKTDALNPGQ